MVTDLSAAPAGAAARIPADSLSDLSLRQLLSFRAVAEEGSFHGAADRLDYTQSAVSQHVMALETSLGVRLFERSRGRRTIALTEAGTLLLRHVESITDRLQAARADLMAYAAGETGTLRVGVYQSVGTRILPAVIARFQRAWPGVEVRLTEASSDEGLLDLIEPGILDLSFGALPLPDGPFEAIELIKDPFVVVVAAGAPQAGWEANPPLRELAAQRLIGFRTCRSTAWVESQLRQAGTEPEFVFRSEDNGTVQAMAGAGLGVALVPLMAVDTEDDAIRIIPTDLAPRRVALIRHRDRYRSPASEAFVALAREVCAELTATLDVASSPAAPRSGGRSIRSRQG